jgi:DnaK suppressor protein
MAPAARVAKAGKAVAPKMVAPKDGAKEPKVAKAAKVTVTKKAKDGTAEHGPVVTEVPVEPEVPVEIGQGGAGEGALAEAPKAKRPRAAAKKTEGAGHEAADRGTDHGESRADFLEHQRVLLMAERRNYTHQAEELRAQAEALALEHEPGDVQFDEEGGEGGTANVDRELDLHLSAQAQAAVEEIDAALDKITAGTYGFCESCGSPVPKARLEALPHARLCVSCKSGGLSARRQ